MAIEDKDWLGIVKKEFNHPATILWRSRELGRLNSFLSKTSLTEPVLDLGCAEGKIGDSLLKGKKVVGLDNCWQLLKQNNREDTYQSLILADACLLPFKNESFGAVFSNCVIEHIPDINTLLVEINRVLKPKGVFLFTVPSHKFGDYLFFSTLFEKMGLKFLAHWYKQKRNKLLNHFHCLSHTQWQDILNGKGFHLFAYEYYISHKEAFLWDMLAVIVLFMPCLNKLLTNCLKTYYNMDFKVGAALLLAARKEGE